MSEILKVRKENQIAYLTMNNPEKRNALSPELKVALVEALKEAERDNDVKVIILSGEGKSFCAGGDIDGMTSNQNVSGVLTKMKGSSEITRIIMELDKYVISAVHGHAAGAGFSLALASDFIVAEQGTKFISSFGNIGLVPDLGLIKLLTERVPLALAKEWISSSKPILAEEIYEIKGVINRLSEDNVLESATEFAQFIIEGPPLANQFVKYLSNHASEYSHQAMLSQENIIQSLMFQTMDTKDAIQSFKDKKAPVFEGK